MKLKFKDVLPNPYRDLKGNPPLKEKIAELKSSIETTGFWDNVVVRKNKAGKYERAYGEHRVRAAIEAGLIEADFIVKDLSDALMIQIMDNENREVYQSSPASMIESVKAVIAALADGTIPPFSIDFSKVNTKHIRYAPSYVPAGALLVSREQQAYTVVAVAQFLGRVGTTGQASQTVEAALNYLHLKELGAINDSILTKDKQPINATKLYEITTDIKKRTEAVQERRGKTQAELEVLRAKQLEAQAKTKADEKKAEEDHRALVKKLADAQREENDRKADALAKQIKEKDERAKAKDVLNKERMKELDKQLADKKTWEAEQRIQDAYLPIRRDVEALMHRLETMVSERNPMREEVKALAKTKALRLEDRVRLQRASMDVSNWFSAWVATQFSAPLAAKQELAELAKKDGK